MTLLDLLAAIVRNDSRLPQAHGGIDMASLPTFGGPEPADTTGVWSWDERDLLVGDGVNDLEIVSRQSTEPYDIWEDETTVTSHDIDVPAWIDQDITGNTVAAITQGGCASGAYMPAVTYHDALETMARHGDDVFGYIDELPAPPEDTSWAGLACFYLSVAVEIWAERAEAALGEQDDD